MRYLKSIIIFTLFSSSIFASSQQTPAQNLSNLLNQFTTLQAQFTQKTTSAHNTLLQHSNGTVMIKRPGQFRFETLKPEHQIVITNGNDLWVYDVALKQATKQSLQNSPMNPATLLSGNVNTLLQQFTVRFNQHSDLSVFQLIPKKNHQQFRSIIIAFSHEKLSSIQIQNNLNQTTQFTFSHIKLNAHLSPSLFYFNAPSGVDVLR